MKIETYFPEAAQTGGSSAVSQYEPPTPRLKMPGA